MKRHIMAIGFTLLFLACALLGPAASAEETVPIPGSLGELYGVLFTPEAEGPVPLVILCHGFGGNHRGNLDYADAFVAAGFAAYSFDFCGGGLFTRSGGIMTAMSVRTEAEDLNAVIDVFLRDSRFSCICLWGESQGGYVSSFVAAQRPDEIAALLLEYPAYVLEDSAKGSRLPDGSFPETGRLLGMPIGRGYYEALAGTDIYAHIAAYGGPVLILHGDRDFLVPLSFSERALEAFPNAELTVMPGQGHGFRGPGRREAMEREIAFLLEHTGQTDLR